jgi:hypothetical protein
VCGMILRVGWEIQKEAWENSKCECKHVTFIFSFVVLCTTEFICSRGHSTLVSKELSAGEFYTFGTIALR